MASGTCCLSLLPLLLPLFSCHWCVIRFIWITGWAVWDKTKLLRTPDRAEDSPSIGELLKAKAAQGVNVSARQAHD
jgi:hypothetical protein